MTLSSCMQRLAATALLGLSVGGAMAAPGTVNVFSDLPMFGIYVSTPPVYTPPPGVVMQKNGTRFVTQLSSAQRALIGSDLKARVTYHAQCDNYDRLGAMFLIVKPVGSALLDTDPITEIARWVTPFSNYWNGAKATYTFPDADLSAFAGLMRNPGFDIWLGLDGGSNPYTGDPCTSRDVTPEFRAVGFRYSLDLISTRGTPKSKSAVAMPVPVADYAAVPVAGAAGLSQASAGTAVVIVSGHGAANGGDEYKHTNDTLMLNGSVVGTFSTMVDCKRYRQFSPDGNPFIFLNNKTNNPRNWCPGALVAARSFKVNLLPQNTVSLGMDDARVPDGSYYRTSITLLPN